LRITSVRLIAPPAYRPIDALTYVQSEGVLTLDRGEEWAVELTFDKGVKKQSKDLRPDLPLLIHY
jgi:hypothetical protein